MLAADSNFDIFAKYLKVTYFGLRKFKACFINTKSVLKATINCNNYSKRFKKLSTKLRQKSHDMSNRNIDFKLILMRYYGQRL